MYSCKFFNFFLGAISNGRATVGCPIGSKMGYGCQKQKKNQVGWHRYKFLGGIGKNPFVVAESLLVMFFGYVRGHGYQVIREKLH